MSALLAHPGTQYSHNLARELHSRGRLSSFHTCLAIGAGTLSAKVVSSFIPALGLERQWQNRLLSGVPAEKLHCYPALEVQAWWRLNRGCLEINVYRRRNNSFQRRIPDRAIDSAKVVIGFDTSSHILATRAREIGKPFVLDRSIAHSRAYGPIAELLHGRFPEWRTALHTKPETELSIEDLEHSLADLIVVPSSFVADSLITHGVPVDKITVNPFGTDTKHFAPAPKPPPPVPFVFLFVGSLTARKGLPLLLEAWRRLRPNKAELWIVGPGTVPLAAKREAPTSVRWLGAAPRDTLADLFRQAHVFVFPSYFEGLAQVLVEAAACGLPVIATAASGAREVIEEGHTGFIIESGDVDQLVEALNKFLDCPSLAREMGECARRKSAWWSWNNYGDRWQQLLKESVRLSS